METHTCHSGLEAAGVPAASETCIHSPPWLDDVHTIASGPFAAQTDGLGDGATALDLRVDADVTQ